MAAARASLNWLGVRKTLSQEQRAQAAGTFGAEGDFLSAGKKLLDTRHEKFKAVTAAKNRVIQYWKSLGLPYPEPGIRLIRQERIDMFDAQMREFRDELDDAVAELDRYYDRLKLPRLSGWALSTILLIPPGRIDGALQHVVVGISTGARMVMRFASVERHLSNRPGLQL
jgi:hypothetical protein